MPKKIQWTADECPDAYGHITIRLSDGTPNGNTDVAPIATVYNEDAARLIAAAPELAAILRITRSPNRTRYDPYKFYARINAVLAQIDGVIL